MRLSSSWRYNFEYQQPEEDAAKRNLKKLEEKKEDEILIRVNESMVSASPGDQFNKSSCPHALLWD